MEQPNSPPRARTPPRAARRRRHRAGRPFPFVPGEAHHEGLRQSRGREASARECSSSCARLAHPRSAVDAVPRRNSRLGARPRRRRRKTVLARFNPSLLASGSQVCQTGYQVSQWRSRVLGAIQHRDSGLLRLRPDVWSTLKSLAAVPSPRNSLAMLPSVLEERQESRSKPPLGLTDAMTGPGRFRERDSSTLC